ncbi:hypothetical protein L873DRAFT_1847801 [Choiromyces venosus 120613-1]|uniref:F-box domain-containing protein n=1 Tax=Choiromyces venosus 120613-1 TaxID=1336337 RepID=A0A3N4J2C4_9PEZI|nr:hypothetical protein L873DRAFT_1847801 [Choiromyces venosus 120613-1]
MLKLIASELSDLDLCNLCLVCQIINNVVQDVWWAKFLNIYYEPSSKLPGKPYDWGRAYRLRQQILLRDPPPMEFWTEHLSEKMET